MESLKVGWQIEGLQMYDYPTRLRSPAICMAL